MRVDEHRCDRCSERVTIKTLPVGARFTYLGEVWRVRHNGSYVDVEAEQFSNHLTFYDSATARKSGDLSWDITVVPIGSPLTSDEERYARCTACGYTGDRVFRRDAEGQWRDVLGGETGVTPDHCVCSHCGGKPFEMVTAPPSRETRLASETDQPKET